MSTRTSMVTLSSSALERFLQAGGYLCRHQPGQVATESGQLLDPAGAEEAVLRRGHQVGALDVGSELAVELVHLELVLEVGDRAQSLDDRTGAVVAGEVDEQVVEGLHFDVAEVGDLRLDEAHALLGREERLLLADRQIDDTDDHAIEDGGGAGDD